MTPPPPPQDSSPQGVSSQGASNGNRFRWDGAPLLIVAGPTASGKSALASDLARDRGGVVINADSMQVYRDLPILTDHPPDDITSRVPHLLYGIIDANQSYSVAAWRKAAWREVTAAWAAGCLPILTGGSGLYLRTFFTGLAPLPPVSAPVRHRAADRHRQLGADAFHRELAARDPRAAARLNKNDTQRVKRAWEVFEATGIPLSIWQERSAPPFDGPAVAVILRPPRDDLAARAQTRFRRMLDRGVVAEVARLLETNLPTGSPVMKALGVQPLARHIRGDLTLEDATQATLAATRAYIKRQGTWFRNQTLGANVRVTYYDGIYTSEAKSRVCDLVMTALTAQMSEASSVAATAGPDYMG